MQAHLLGSASRLFCQVCKQEDSKVGETLPWHRRLRGTDASVAPCASKFQDMLLHSQHTEPAANIAGSSETEQAMAQR